MEEVLQIVLCDMLQRFQTFQYSSKHPVEIRAVDGHYISMRVDDSGLYGMPIPQHQLPRYLYHATTNGKSLQDILEFGLMPGWRHYIHLYDNLERIEDLYILRICPIATRCSYFRAGNHVVVTRGDTLRRIPVFGITAYSTDGGRSFICRN